MGSEVATVSNTALVDQEVPDYLKGNENSRLGMEALGQGDYKIPRILLLQALNPECRAFPGKAIPGYFWHNGANISLGQKINVIPSIVAKKVILFRPRWEGGGILAMSNDAVKWDNGGNKSFTVKPVDKSEKTVVYNTGSSVASSGLTKWGSGNPEVENSPPAATAIYEYLVYLPDHPELSPCLIGMSKTALPEGRALNTTLMMAKKPIQSLKIELAAKERTENNNTWYVPASRRNGFASLQEYNLVTQMASQYQNYQAEYTEDLAPTSAGETTTAKEDEIPF